MYDGVWLGGRPVGQGIKSYKDGSSRKGRWQNGVFVVIGNIEEHEKKDHSEAMKPIDVTKLSRGAPISPEEHKTTE